MLHVLNPCENPWTIMMSRPKNMAFITMSYFGNFRSDLTTFSGNAKKPIMNAKMPIGILIRNSHLHVNDDKIKAPNDGPKTDAIATNVAFNPIPIPRIFFG